MPATTEQLARSIETMLELDTAENALRASRSLEYVLRIHGEGAANDLADALGVTRQTIFKWRNGRTRLTVPMVARIAEHYGIPVELMYSDNHLDATRWLLDYSSTHFPWSDSSHAA